MPELLTSFHDTGLLSSNNVNNPYSAHTSGFLPGEAVAALALEVSARPGPRVLAALSNSDAYHNVGLPPDAAPTIRLLQDMLRQPALRQRHVSAICPHASGTLAHGMAEQKAIATVFDGDARPVSLHFMKPFTGHSLGASGAIDCVLLCAFLREARLPPNLPGLDTPCPNGLPAPDSSLPFDPACCLLKIATGMGGRNTVVAFGI